MVAYFCPGCWARVPGTAATCPVCAADLAHLDRDAFDAKLIRALDHPESQTARRAAHILGDRGTLSAILALMAHCETGADPYLRAEIALTLRCVGGPDGAAALARLAEDPSVIVRRAAAEALESEAVR